MLRATEIKPDVYWVGGIDWTERNFHGYTTDRGSTYNAYLILDEHVTLIDTLQAAVRRRAARAHLRCHRPGAH